MSTNEQNNVHGETFQSSLDKYGFTSSKTSGCKDSSIKKIKPKTIVKGKKQNVIIKKNWKLNFRVFFQMSGRYSWDNQSEKRSETDQKQVVYFTVYHYLWNCLSQQDQRRSSERDWIS